MDALRTPWRLMPLEQWIDLAVTCGFAMDDALLDQILQYDILQPIDAEDGPSLGLLHLWALDRYWSTSLVVHHPWDTPQAPDLMTYINWYEQAHQHMEQVYDGSASSPWLEDHLGQWLLEQACFPEPLTALVQSFHPDVIAGWSGRARLWAELATCHRALEAAPGETITTRTTMRVAQVDPLGMRQTAEIESPFKKVQLPSSDRTTLSLDALSREDLDAQEPSVAEEDSAPQEERVEPALRPALRVTAEMDAVSFQSERFAEQQQEGLAEPDAVDEADGAEAPENEETVDLPLDQPAPVQPESAKLTKPNPTLELKQRLSQLSAKVSVPTPISEAPTEALEVAAEPEPQPVEAHPEPAVESSVEGVEGVEEISEMPEVSESSEVSISDEISEGLEVASEQASPVVESPTAAPPQLPPEVSKPTPPSIPAEEAEPVSDVPVADEAPSKEQLAAQIKTLNQKREQYMRAQNWEGLVHLYEDGIDLFGTRDRPQIYTTLSKLYEVKLQKPDKALENMILAHALSGNEKHEQQVHRLGQHAAAHDQYHEWLTASLDDDGLTHARRLLLVQKRARLDQSSGNVRQGFLSFAALLTEVPALAFETANLETLDDLGQALGFEELDAIYGDLYGEALDDQARQRIAVHAGLSALEHDRDDRAMHYLWQSIAIDPSNDAAFHSLASVCEESQSWHHLVRLYALRARHEPQNPVLQERLADYRQRMFEQPDGAIAYYQERLEQTPDDIESLDELSALYGHQQRHGELYGLLNRHLEQTTALEAKVHTLMLLADIAATNLYAPEEAALHYQKVMELISGQEQLMIKLIERCLNTQLWSVAVDAIDTMTTDKDISLDSSQKVHWLMIGTKAAMSSNRLRDKRRFLENVLALEPNNKEAQRMLQD